MTHLSRQSAESLRDLINERLNAAAEEIFRVFHKTIVDYEEEIDRQRRMLETVWKPEIRLQRTEFPQQHVWKEAEEVLVDQQQLCSQDRNSSLDQEDPPEPPQVKEEQEDCSSLQGDQLVLKQETETETFMLESEDQTVDLSPDETQEPEPEATSEDQLLSHGSHVDHKGGSAPLQTHSNTFKCDTCGKCFQYKSKLHTHLRVHTGEKPYPCNTCGRKFSDMTTVKRHIRTHTGEKPYPCNTCEKGFCRMAHLKKHMRVHTGENLNHNITKLKEENSDLFIS